MRPALHCLVWEPDHTLWNGAVSDGSGGALRPAALRTLRLLHDRGVLHAVAGRGHRERTVAALAGHGVLEYFSAVEVGWGRKSGAVLRIARTLGVGLDVIGFVDPEPVERAEVAGRLPLVRCYAARNTDVLPALADFRPVLRSNPYPTPPLGFARVPAR
ncbi:hypothetical protein [Nocardia harenae]|uniref:hypothetical protein n=1 Tax=Nocardia harenae TaxID=358707 RepID=UPI00082F7471|nr:hypothetical protein [Nocardia harenae]